MTGPVAPVTTAEATGVDPPKGESGPPLFRVGCVCSGLLSEAEFDNQSEHDERLPIEVVLVVENDIALLQRSKEMRPNAIFFNDMRGLVHDLESGRFVMPLALDILTVTAPCYDETRMSAQRAVDAARCRVRRYADVARV